MNCIFEMQLDVAASYGIFSKKHAKPLDFSWPLDIITTSESQLRRGEGKNLPIIKSRKCRKIGGSSQQNSANVFFDNLGAPGIDRTVVVMVACRPVMQVVKLCGNFLNATENYKFPVGGASLRLAA